MSPEEWVFTAQQAVEKLLKVCIVLNDQRPCFTHMLQELGLLAVIELDPGLFSLQPYTVEAGYEEGLFPLMADRSSILEQIVTLRNELQQEL